MIPIAVTQRVAEFPAVGERRDCLDQRWTLFLKACGLFPVLLPNDVEVATTIVREIRVRGLLITGGDDLEEFGGHTPERDRTEYELLKLSADKSLPIIGLCRGMQVIQRSFGVVLERITGHVCDRMIIQADAERRSVNSFHTLGAKTSHDDLRPWAVADDGIVKAVQHTSMPITGIMWHPERMDPFDAIDLALFTAHFAPVLGNTVG